MSRDDSTLVHVGTQVYRRRSAQTPLPDLEVDSEAVLDVYMIYWPLLNHQPHVGLLLQSSALDGISVYDPSNATHSAVAVGNSLLVDLRRRYVKRVGDYEAFIELQLYRGTVVQTLHQASLIFSCNPVARCLCSLPTNQIRLGQTFTTLLRELDGQPFDLSSNERGVNCLAVVNDVLSHYTSQRRRLELREAVISTRQAPRYSILWVS